MRGCGQAGAGMLVRLLRAGHGHVSAADLPRELQRPRRRQAGNAALYTGANWTNTRAARRAGRAQSEPGRRGERALHDRDLPHNLAAAGYPAQLLRPQSGRQQRRRQDQRQHRRSTTRCRSTCGARCPAGWRSTPTTCSPGATPRALDTLREDRDARAVDRRRAARAEDDRASTSCRSAAAGGSAPT